MGKKIEVKGGDRYGRLVVIKEEEPYHYASGQRHRKFLCDCDCGRQITININNLRTKHTQSCGCMRNAMRKTLNLSHGMSYTSTYRIWAGMIGRCTNKKNVGFHRYGGRGITVCKRWQKFESFFADMGERPEGKSLDRIKNDKGYYKENCRWATPEQQARNRRSNKMVVYKEERMTLADLCDRKGVDYGLVRARIGKYRWSINKAVNTPARGWGR